MASLAHARVPQPLITVGRVGWAVRGLVYLAFGAAVWAVVMSGSGGRAADTKGGIDLIADVVPDWWLYGIGVGLIAYALWRLTEAALPYGDWGGTALAERAGFLFSAGVYGALAWISLEIASGDRSAGSGSGSAGSSDGLAAGLLANSAGRIGLGLVGLVILGVGAYFTKQGVDRDFEDHLDDARLPVDGALVTPLGIVGHVARGVVYGVVGVFLVSVAVRYEPEKARGVDRALTEVGQTAWGRPLLGLTAVGLLAYGLYCLVSAPAQELETPRRR